MRSSTLYLAFLPYIAHLAAAQTIPRVGPANANCTRSAYKLAISSNNVAFKNFDLNPNETIITKLFQDYVSSSANFTGQYTAPEPTVVTNTYSLSGTLCTPISGARNASQVQFLIHGIGFDSSYWDFTPYSDESYSYVYTAAEEGYTTFRYDRLGTGLSEKPTDAYNVVQAATDLAIATDFAQMLRNGSIGGQAFDTIVGVGHSYGSIQAQALTAAVPDALDAVVLTGFSANTTAVPLYLTSTAYSTATNVFPARFSTDELTNGYLATLAPWTNQIDFWYFPYYSDASFDLARETEQPVTQGVLFTFGLLPAIAQNFTGPVHVVTGDRDFIFCYNDCYAVPVDSTQASILDYAQELYPQTTNFTTYIPANTGHAVNQHYSAPETYQEILSFVASAL